MQISIDVISKILKMRLAEKVKDGETVKVKIEPIYEGDSHRPTDILVTYSINGVEDMRIFPNKKEN